MVLERWVSGYGKVLEIQLQQDVDSWNCWLRDVYLWYSEMCDSEQVISCKLVEDLLGYVCEFLAFYMPFFINNDISFFIKKTVTWKFTIEFNFNYECTCNQEISCPNYKY